MAMPDRLAEIVEEFADLPAELRLEALLDYSRRCPRCPSAWPAIATRWRPCRSARRRSSWPPSWTTTTG